MSFDLFFWSDRTGVGVESAAQIYEGAGLGLPAAASIGEFVTEIASAFPEPAEDGPFNAAIQHTSAFVITAIGWRRYDQVTPVLVEMAKRHGLTTWDPQNRQLHRPGDPPMLVLTSADSAAFNPGPDRIADEIRHLDAENWFVTLSRGQSFAQTGFGRTAGVRPGHYAVERRDAAGSTLLQTIVTDVDDAIEALQGFANGNDSWKQRHSWKPVTH